MEILSERKAGKPVDWVEKMKQDGWEAKKKSVVVKDERCKDCIVSKLTGKLCDASRKVWRKARCRIRMK